MRTAIAALALLAALPALAEAPRSSPRPEARPFVAVRPAAPAAPPAIARPAVPGTVQQPAAPRTAPQPAARPRGFAQTLRGIFGGGDGRSRTIRYANAVCGLPDVAGTPVQRIPGRIRGCGVEDPVRVAAVAGVVLDRPAVMNCRTARALRDWVAGGVLPAFEAQGGVTSMKVAAGYVCRTRNNRPGGRISEHGKGNAIDISAFRLGNGREVTVLQGWRALSSRAPLRAAWRAACGPFGTVLGPDADRYHQDHLHLDTARYRSGSYCR